MLELEPTDFLLRAIPEGFLLILGVYVFSKKKIDKNKYLISSLISSIVFFFTRKLPISYGVHTIIIIIYIVLLSVLYNKIDSYKVITSTFIVFILQYLSEALNLLLFKFIGLNINIIFQNPITKNIAGLPSVIISGLIMYIFYKKFKEKDGLVSD